jgi:hypothetical protein
MHMLQRRTRWLSVGLLATGLALTGCADTGGGGSDLKGPATLIEDGDVPQVVLTDKAVQRLGIDFAPVGGGPGAKVIPYAAVIYDSEGKTWAYTTPKALTFQRQPITVASITGDTATLTEGPDVGTRVVTVGGAELLGVEAGIGY